MATKRKPLKLTDLERQVVLGLQGRYRAIEVEAALARQAVAADQRAFEAVLAGRLGLPVDALSGDKYAVNTETWTLDPVEKATPDGQ